MGKGKVSVKQGNALDSALEMYSGELKIVEKIIMHTIKGGWSQERQELHDMDFELLCTALINGYEVEETPEEKLLKIYNENHEIARTTPVVAYQWRANGFNEGVRYMCKEYGIEIKGINEE